MMIDSGLAFDLWRGLDVWMLALCLPMGYVFSAAAGLSAASIISGIGAAGTFASGAANVIGSFSSGSSPQPVPAHISPAKGAYESEAMEFLADLYQQLAAQLGYTYDANGQLTYSPTASQQYWQASSSFLGARDMMRSLGMEVEPYGTEMSTEQLIAEYQELQQRSEALAASMGGVPPTPQPTERGPFADPDVPELPPAAAPAPPLPPIVDPNDPANWISS